MNVLPQIQALHGGPAISIHTHPGSSSFSDFDAKLLLVGMHYGVRVVGVVGADWRWYLLSALSGAPLASPEEMAWKYASERSLLDPLYDGLVYIEAMTEAEAWIDQSHAIWENIAPALGLRYDRVEPPSGRSVTP